MTNRGSIRRIVAAASCVAVTASGCAFDGLNSMALPGAVGRGPDAVVYHVELADVGTLEANSPVMMGDVVIGSIGRMTPRDWHADLEISVKPDVVVPANAVATVGQTSLLGSMHVALNPPLGQAPQGRLAPGSTLGLDRSSTYPSTEETLSSLSVVINGGGLGQIADVIHNFSTALHGREDQVRDLLSRLDKFVGLLDAQRDDINATINSLNRLSATFAGQRDVITQALKRIPPALDVLIKERPRITTALEKFRDFSNTATGLVNDSGADLVRNLKNLEPTLRALADIGPDLGTAIAYAPTFPYSQSFVDRGIRGDYMNQFIVFDLTVPRLKRGLFAGTRWGEPDAKLVPAPGDPAYVNYSYDPLSAPLTAPGTPPLPGPPAPESAPAAGSAPESAPPAEAPPPGPPPGPVPAPSDVPPQDEGGS